MSGSIVELWANEPVISGRERDIAASLDQLVLEAEHYRKALTAAYGVEAAFTTI